jgi:CRP-like cAMP-binding protein
MTKTDLPTSSSHGSMKQNYFALKLSKFAPLSEADQAALDTLAAGAEFVAKGKDLVVEGDVASTIFLLTEGMAMRYHTLPNGGRQIINFLIPGDLCSMHIFLSRKRDHSIAAVTPIRVAPISHKSMAHCLAHHPGVSTALSWVAIQEEAVLQERVISLGRRDARGRIAHLVCELFWRHKAVGLTDDQAFRLPLTQEELGDALGLTQVHVNRVMRIFYEQKLIGMEQRKMCLLDLNRLQRIAGVEEDYLHPIRLPENFERRCESSKIYHDNFNNIY